MKKYVKNIILILGLLFSCSFQIINVSAYDPMKRDLDAIRSVFPYEFLEESICWRMFRSANFMQRIYVKPKEKVEGILFVGDSRVVGMSQVGGYAYVGKNGEGYSWFVDDGVYAMIDLMEMYPDYEIVLCLGVNDLVNIDLYVPYYQMLMDDYPDYRFWVMSVNPCSDSMAEENGYYMKNSMIESFNEIMSTAFPDQYIDCYSYLRRNGFGTYDGIHYDDGTYIAIQEYARYCIEYYINKES